MLVLAIILTSCKKDDEVTYESAPITLDETSYELNLGSFPPPMTPQGFQLTNAKVGLGRMLFYEEKLSSLNNQLCAGRN